MYQEQVLVITFAQTMDAMALEACFTENKLPGRLIPVPTVITASCGLAWQAKPTAKQVLIKALNEYHLNYQAVTLITLERRR